MANKLASYRASQLTESGVSKGTNALDTPLWSDARNVVFRDGGPQKVGGFIVGATIAGAGIIRGMDATMDETFTQRIFFGTASALYKIAPGTAEGIVSLAGGIAGYVDETASHIATTWSFARYGNWMICVNGVSPPLVWKSGTSAALLAGATFTKAEIVKQSRSYVLAFNTSNAGTYIEWSDADNPESWTPTSTNSAGNVQIRDMDGPIVAVTTLGEQFLVLGRNQAYLLSFVGEPLIWQYQPALVGIGACSKQSVVEVNRTVYGMDAQGFWATDGVTFRRIGTTQIWDWVKSVYASGGLSKVAATYDSTTETVYWSIPSASGEPTVTVGFTVPTQAWTILDFGRGAWIPQTGVYAFPIGASGNVIYYHAFAGATDAAGSAMTAYVQTKPLDLEDPRAWKYLEALQFQFRKLTGTVKLFVGWQSDLDDAIEWDSGTVIDDGFEPVYTQASGRFLSFKLQSDTLGANWAISGFDVFGDIGGTV